MLTNKRKSGFILLLVVAMIPLIGMVIAIMSVNSKVLTIKTRHALLQVQADNACRSGLAWAWKNSTRIGQESAQFPTLLILEDGRVRITCRLERVHDPESGTMIKVTGHAESRQYSANSEHLIDLQAF